MNTEHILIRPATWADLNALVAVELKAWDGMGTEIYGYAHFQAWMETNPQCFWVAEFAGRVVGYVYGQTIDFCLESLPTVVSCEELTDNGFTRATHTPDGNTLYGHSIASIYPGAGGLLIRQLYQLVATHRFEQYIGFPRISGFSEYASNLKIKGSCDILSASDELQMALWYAKQCAVRSNVAVWNVFPLRNDVRFPVPFDPDPVLNWHAKHWNIPNRRLGLLSVLPNFMKDQQSLGYAALLCADMPGLE